MSSLTIVYEIDAAGAIKLIPAALPDVSHAPLTCTIRPAKADQPRPDRVAVELAGEPLVDLDADEPAQKYVHSLAADNTITSFLVRVRRGTIEAQLELRVAAKQQSRLAVEFNLLPPPPPKPPGSGSKPNANRVRPAHPTDLRARPLAPKPA